MNTNVFEKKIIKWTCPYDTGDNNCSTFCLKLYGSVDTCKMLRKSHCRRLLRLRRWSEELECAKCVRQSGVQSVTASHRTKVAQKQCGGAGRRRITSTENNNGMKLTSRTRRESRREREREREWKKKREREGEIDGKREEERLWCMMPLSPPPPTTPLSLSLCLSQWITEEGEGRAGRRIGLYSTC